ncbi:MAG: outer membrane beta-barrel protein [Candidatus Zixiibacteriota bacterium]
MKIAKYLTLLCMILISSSAMALDIGVGAVGGVAIPIVQEDQDNGTMFGFKGKLSVIPGIVVEPNIYLSQLGDSELGLPGTKVTSFGIDALIGGQNGKEGITVYGIVGLGFYSMTRDLATFEDVTKFGFSAGLGMEIGVIKDIGIDIRGKLDVINAEGGGSKKSAAILGGLNYYFGL